MTRDEAIKIFSVGFERFLNRSGLTLEAAGHIMDSTKGNASRIKQKKGLPSVEGLFSLVEKGMTLEEIFGAELADKLIKNICTDNVSKEPVAHSDPSIFDSEEFRQGVLKVLSEEQILKFKMNQSSDKLIDNIKK